MISDNYSYRWPLPAPDPNIATWLPLNFFWPMGQMSMQRTEVATSCFTTKKAQIQEKRNLSIMLQ